MKISCIILLLSLVALSEGCQCPETNVEVEEKKTICIGGSYRKCAIGCVKVVFELSDADVTWFPLICLTRLRILSNANLGIQLDGTKKEQIKKRFCILGKSYTGCLKYLKNAEISIEKIPSM